MLFDILHILIKEHGYVNDFAFLSMKSIIHRKNCLHHAFLSLPSIIYTNIVCTMCAKLVDRERMVERQEI